MKVRVWFLFVGVCFFATSVFAARIIEDEVCVLSAKMSAPGELHWTVNDSANRNKAKVMAEAQKRMSELEAQGFEILNERVVDVFPIQDRVTKTTTLWYRFSCTHPNDTAPFNDEEREMIRAKLGLKVPIN